MNIHDIFPDLKTWDTIDAIYENGDTFTIPHRFVILQASAIEKIQQHNLNFIALRNAQLGFIMADWIDNNLSVDLEYHAGEAPTTISHRFFDFGDVPVALGITGDTNSTVYPLMDEQERPRIISPAFNKHLLAVKYNI